MWYDIQVAPKRSNKHRKEFKKTFKKVLTMSSECVIILNAAPKEESEKKFFEN